MNNTFNTRMTVSALALVACTACGSALQLTPETGHAGSSTAAVNSAGNANVSGAANANTTGAAATDSNGQAANSNTFSFDALNCAAGMINGAQLSSCTCSTDNNQYCPLYNTEPNATGESWVCNTTPVAGGYVYNCSCGEVRDPNDKTPPCSDFYDPSNPVATQSPNEPNVTCNTQATNTGMTTTCICDDTNASPCTVFQGNTEPYSAAPYVESCNTTLTATGATTVCTCDSASQTDGATCPATFSPYSEVVDVPTVGIL